MSVRASSYFSAARCSGSSGFRQPGRGRTGFTLIELLGVILILAILAGITFGALRSGGERSRANLARAELSILTQLLSRYEAQYGTYPILYETDIDQGAELFVAILRGQLGPTGLVMNPPGRDFLAGSNLTLADELAADSAPNRLLDPWGQPYRYFYQSDDNWLPLGYLLYSSGPDQLDQIPAPDGAYDERHTTNLDNVFP